MKQVKCCGTCTRFRINNGEVENSVFNCDLFLGHEVPVKMFDEGCNSYQPYSDSQEFILDCLGVETYIIK